MRRPKVRRWWRVGLTAQQIEALEIEARALCDVNGPVARKVILDRARSFGKRNWLEGRRLSRLAACMADQMKESTHKDHAENDPERQQAGASAISPG